MGTDQYRVSDAVGAPEPVPALVTLDIWGVPRSAIPRALARMGTDRTAVRRLPGVTFAKMLGTGSGRTFTMRDADLTHWAALLCWSDATAAAAFPDTPPAMGWSVLAGEHARCELRPLASRGTWAQRHPFGAPVAHRWDGPVAAVTRARIKPAQWAQFWKAVPPVSLELDSVDGVLFRLGIGEAPLGLQGTFSVWRNNSALTEFAQRRPEHRAAIARTHTDGWYAEELFARFAVVGMSGQFNGRDIGIPS